MNKPTIADALRQRYAGFFALMESLDSEKFVQSRNGKWSPGQQLDHIFRAVQPVRYAFLLPGFMLRLFFGKVNRPGRSYEELVNRYKEKLARGGRATGRFVPSAVPFAKRTSLIAKTKSEVESLIRNMNRYSESDLDNYLLPHPLLGKLTLREMLYFTIYHVEHHEFQTSGNL